MSIEVAAVQSLQSQWKPEEIPQTVVRVPLKSLELLPAVYQARIEGRLARGGIVDKNHVARLAALLKDEGKDLDPIKVLRVGRRNIVIDGHHRVAAYRRQKRRDIPVSWFAGSPRDALIEAGRENSKSHLPMTTADRSERAWELVCSELYSIKQIAEGASVARRTVSNMRRVRNEYVSKGQEIPESWAEVRQQSWDLRDESGEALKGRELVDRWVKALNSAVGPASTFRTTGKLALFAEALHQWGPVAMEQVYNLLFDIYGASEHLLARLEEQRDELASDLGRVAGELAELAQEQDERVEF